MCIESNKLTTYSFDCLIIKMVFTRHRRGRFSCYTEFIATSELILQDDKRDKKRN